MAGERVSQGSREMILRPLGPQGPMIGVEITQVGDVMALDYAMGELPEEERRTVPGIFKAVRRAGLNVIDSSRMPDQSKMGSPDDIT